VPNNQSKHSAKTSTNLLKRVSYIVLCYQIKVYLRGIIN